jgi:hypothetical protein
MVNTGLVNAYSRCNFSRQEARFSAFSPGNLRFKNPVKYNLKTRINLKPRTAGRVPGADNLKIIQQKTPHEGRLRLR